MHNRLNEKKICEIKKIAQKRSAAPDRRGAVTAPNRGPGARRRARRLPASAPGAATGPVAER
jgi:hypothetical protein